MRLNTEQRLDIAYMVRRGHTATVRALVPKYVALAQDAAAHGKCESAELLADIADAYEEALEAFRPTL